MKTRIGSLGDKEIKIQPDGLPAIWVKLRFCDRCKPYQECLGFKELSDSEWDEINDVIVAVDSCHKLEIEAWRNTARDT